MYKLSKAENDKTWHVANIINIKKMHQLKLPVIETINSSSPYESIRIINKNKPILLKLMISFNIPLPTNALIIINNMVL